MAAVSGKTSMSIIILLLIATAVGALVGLFLGGIITGTRTLAISAGLIATIVASIARYKAVFLGAGVGPDDSKVPGVVVVNAAIASIAGSLAAHDIANHIATPPSAILLGTFAGLLSAVLLALLMVTYHATSTAAR
ncbi:hypothetical protein W911_11415 [Hyphomicrobium nitrativorans NL23]|uniref:Uncharacterized protein n=1 Tax=Hyphomicrobium nitrativorans NL23 TaxID=1029756 RepID=V5SI90_9HYPH|nr:hypothetical protein [Hyphomicrobium nitrativorans]AHB50217.1 hypothetical protein W911_11415 [Hyphomicrobium nitrativorans NL23]